MNVICQICAETIGIVSREDLSFPMRGLMFKSPDPFHGFAPPFPPEAEWESMKCPYGPHGPFLDIDRILTDEGIVFASGGPTLEVKLGDVIPNHIKEKLEVTDEKQIKGKERSKKRKKRKKEVKGKR
jgi:hypothetical protein